MDILDIAIAKKLSGGGGGTTVIGGSGDIVQDPDDVMGGMVVAAEGTTIDNTLTMEGYAADAKAVGDRLSAVGGGKTELIYESGNVIKHNGESVNFQFIIDELKANPRFTYLLYGNRAYLPSLIEDDDQGIHYIYFESTMIDGGMSKNAVVIVYSNDGVAISGINTRNVANENYSNKVSAITDRNSGDVNSYTSVKAVVDYVKPLSSDIAQQAINAESTLGVCHDVPVADVKSLTVVNDWNTEEPVHVYGGKNYRTAFYFPVKNRSGVTISSIGDTVLLNGSSSAGSTLGWQISKVEDIPQELLGQNVELIAFCDFPFANTGKGDQRIKVSIRNAGGTEIASKSAYFNIGAYSSSVTFAVDSTAKTIELWWYAQSGVAYQDARIRVMLRKTADAKIDTGIMLADGEHRAIDIASLTGDCINTVPFMSKVAYGMRTQEYIDSLPDARFGVFTPEMFGASGAEDADDSAAIQACINAAIANGKTAMLNGIYYTKQPITISAPCKILGDSIHYLGNDTAILMLDTADIHLREILSYGNGVTLKDPTGKEVTNIRIDIDRINASKNCIEFTQAANELGKWWYSEIHVGRMQSGSAYTCIKAMDDMQKTNLNDINFFVNSVNGGWGVSGAFGNCKFYNLAFELLSLGGMRLADTVSCSIIYPRYAEITDRRYTVPFIKFVGKCAFNSFIGAYGLTTSKIDVSEMTAYDTGGGALPNSNIFTAPIKDASGYDLGDSANATNIGVFVRQWGMKRAYDVVDAVSWVGSEYEGQSGKIVPRYPSEIYVRNINATVHLPKAYGADGINCLTIYQGDGKKAIVVDADNNTIFDGSALSDGVYQLSAAAHGAYMSDGAYAIAWAGERYQYTKWTTVKVGESFSLSYDPIYQRG